ncbi:MAG: helix-turn-helix transcriptional regulator [Chloroflexi bacterium]|nr:helix-turn-helix transcriptional regulator [Chloroflexota bacterium]
MDPLQITRRQAADKLKYLTPRQSEILFLVACGYSYKEITGMLSISYSTVIQHVHNARFRLKADTTLQMVVLMARSRP